MSLLHDDTDDRYFDLAALVKKTGLSKKTLERYMDDPVNPLPSHYLHRDGRERGIVMISKREFDAWVLQFPPKPKMAKASQGTRDWVRKLAGK